MFYISYNNGFITIYDKKKKKTVTLSVNEKYNDFILKSIYSDKVIFSKNNKDYILKMVKNSIKKNIVNKKQVQKSQEAEFVQSIGDNKFILTRDLLNEYLQDYKKIWTQISIKEIKKNNKTDYFLVSNIRKNGIFDRLGLKKGDIIKSVNNIPLTSYAQAMKLYNQVKEDIYYLRFEIVREKEIMELDYEIE